MGLVSCQPVFVSKKTIAMVSANKIKTGLAFLVFLTIGLSCQNRDSTKQNQLSLKRGDLISCGPSDQQFGKIDFELSCREDVKPDFNLAISLLHSFEYDEAEKLFAKIIDGDPNCAMAYWGVAMSNFHPLWTPPSSQEFEKGKQALKIAQAIKSTPEKSKSYIEALYQFYNDADKADHRTRCIRYEKAMETLRYKYPEDKEVAIFYALALDAAADPFDKTFSNQLKAGSILKSLYPAEPNHPGIIHYLIHTYDYPGLADSALFAARKYASVAPSSSHALHMPSHIFIRLGLWDEAIRSNKHSVEAAKCYAEQAKINGHWDEELHGLDYLVYAYLQKKQNDSALRELAYLNTIKKVYPENIKVAYAFAAIPSRICLENKNWQEAARLTLIPTQFPWAQFPWQAGIIYFSRLLGAVHLKQFELAQQNLDSLKSLQKQLQNEKDIYKTKKLAIQIQTGVAWIHYKEGKKDLGLKEMELASKMEDSTEKHPVTPGEVLPARELLADMYFDSGRFPEALKHYEAVLVQCPNRYNSLIGAGHCLQKLNKKVKAKTYFDKILAFNTGSI